MSGMLGIHPIMSGSIGNLVVNVAIVHPNTILILPMYLTANRGIICIVSTMAVHLRLEQLAMSTRKAAIFAQNVDMTNLPPATILVIALIRIMVMEPIR